MQGGDPRTLHRVSRRWPGRLQMRGGRMTGTSRAKWLSRRSRRLHAGNDYRNGMSPRPEAAHMRLLRRAHIARALWERSGAVWRRVRENGVRDQRTRRLSAKGASWIKTVSGTPQWRRRAFFSHALGQIGAEASRIALMPRVDIGDGKNRRVQFRRNFRRNWRGSGE
jgi:hypothetical protein